MTRPIQSDQIDAVAAALVKAQGQIEGAIKDSTNPHFRSRYADLTSVWEACRSALHANGLAVTQLPFPAEGDREGFVLRTVLMHSSGQFIASELPIECNQGKPQEVGSALTYARRYSLAAIVGVCPEDDDAEAATSPYRDDPSPRSRSASAPRQQSAPQSAPSGHSAAQADNRTYGQLVADGAAKFQVSATSVHRELLGEAVYFKYIQDPGRLVDDEEVVRIMTDVYRHRRDWVRSMLTTILKRMQPGEAA